MCVLVSEFERLEQVFGPFLAYIRGLTRRVRRAAACRFQSKVRRLCQKMMTFDDIGNYSVQPSRRTPPHFPTLELFLVGVAEGGQEKLTMNIPTFPNIVCNLHGVREAADRG